MICPNCKTELPDGCTDCFVCGWEADSEERNDWTLIGTVENAAFAGLAKETLEASGIPVVVMSKSGFFGYAGLMLRPFFDAGKSWAFELAVPAWHRREAEDILDGTLGEKWKRGVS